MRKRVALALFSFALGCDRPVAGPLPGGGSSSPSRGGTLHFASIGDIRTLDPAAASDALSGMVLQMMFAGLVDFDEQGNVVPDLASSYERSSDGLSITFRLREGVRFHDGNELTAEDVKRSIDRALHPDTPNAFASFFERLEGFDDYRNKKTTSLAGVTVGGRYVVTIRLTKRDALLLPVLALHALRPVCASGGHRYDDAWHPCGAGPFRLQPGGWERGRHVTVVRHEGYFRPGLPYLDAVQFSYLVNAISQRYKFEAGELDVFRDLTQADLSKYESDPRWKPFGTYEPPRAIFGEAMNVERPPFDNVEVRRAVAAAIDRDAFRALRPGTVVPTGKAIPDSVPGFSKTVEGQKFDLAAALEHMKKAGYPYDPTTGKGGYPHPIEYLAYRPSYSEYSAQLLQQQLARIGLRLDLKFVSFATYLTLSQRRGRIGMSSQGWNQDFPDALDFYEPLFSSRAISDEHSSNAGFFRNAELDALLERAREELDPAQRQALYDRVQEIVRDEAPWAMTHANRWFVVRQPYVRDLALHSTFVFDTKSTWIDRARAALASRAGVFGPVLARSTR